MGNESEHDRSDLGENKEGVGDQVGPWDVTPERIARMQEVAENMARLKQAVEEATPMYVPTGEEGKFSTWIPDVGGGFRPLYMTEKSGTKFVLIPLVDSSAQGSKELEELGFPMYGVMEYEEWLNTWQQILGNDD